MAPYERTYTGERRTVKRPLQLTPKEDAKLKAGAKACGASWSDFTRELVLTEFRRPVVRALILKPLLSKASSRIRSGLTMGSEICSISWPDMRTPPASSDGIGSKT
jgi:hypothetical protein